MRYTNKELQELITAQEYMQKYAHEFENSPQVKNVTPKIKRTIEILKSLKT